jgi:hypothetical protein
MMSAGESRHKQYITLFDHIDDDEYDGEMGENDDEVPRVHFQFQITSENIGKPYETPQATVSAKTKP